MTTAATYYGAATITLTEGLWLLNAHTTTALSHTSATSTRFISRLIVNSAQVAITGETTESGTQIRKNMSLTAIVTVNSTVTAELEAAWSGGAGDKIIVASESGLTAVKICDSPPV
jgi:hypothetical protein